MNKQSKLSVDIYENKFWTLNEELHREDGPAIEYANGDKRWYLNGKRHRIDGPAIEYANGSKYWFLNGREYFTKEEWFQKLTPEQQYNLLWNFDE